MAAYSFAFLKGSFNLVDGIELLVQRLCNTAVSSKGIDIFFLLSRHCGRSKIERKSSWSATAEQKTKSLPLWY